MNVYKLKNNVYINCGASIVGKIEGEGPLSKEFDIIEKETKFSQDTWEKSEMEMFRIAVGVNLKKAGLIANEIDIAFGGDLINQCTSSSLGIKEYGFSYVGLYGACSTFPLSLALGSLSVDSGCAKNAICCASSHFCSAERQFRFPIEYGSQRTPTSQNTVTGAGSVILDKTSVDNPRIKEFLIGKIVDFNISDTNNMGAAMAPAAVDTIFTYFKQSGARPQDFDMILTGDLGKIGKSLTEQMLSEKGIDISYIYNDCGVMIYDLSRQDVHAGGSGCGCCASVFSGYILNLFKKRKIKDILLVGTGALLNSTSVLQKQSIPGIAHLIRIGV